MATNDENTYLGRGDFYLGAHQLSARFNYNHQDYVTPLLYPSLPRPYPLRFHNALLHDTWTVKPTIVNELRLGFNRSNLNRFEPGRDKYPAWITVSDGTINASLPSFIDFTDTTYTLTDNLSMIRGNHSMKAGFEIRVVRSNRGQGGQPTMYYRTLPDLIADNPYQLQLLFGSGRALNDTNYGFYFQDNWRLTPKLQLNLGLRYDYFPPLKGGFNVATSNPYGPFIPNTSAQMFAPDRNNWAPRLGVVYDPTGKQKLVIRAGAGITYLPPQPYFFFNMAFIDPRLALTAIVTPQDLGGISAKYPFPQAVTDSIIANPSLLPSTLILSRLVADYNARDTYAEQWNFSVQTALTSSTALQVSYVGNHTLKLPEPVPLNLTDATLGRGQSRGWGKWTGWRTPATRCTIRCRSHSISGSGTGSPMTCTTHSASRWVISRPTIRRARRRIMPFRIRTICAARAVPFRRISGTSSPSFTRTGFRLRSSRPRESRGHCSATGPCKGS